MNILHLPSPNERQAISEAIRTFLATKSFRALNQADSLANDVFARYKISRLPLAGYYVTRGQLGINIVATLLIPSQQHFCPKCGADIDDKTVILGISKIPKNLKKVRVTLGCSCGQVFGKISDALGVSKCYGN